MALTHRDAIGQRSETVRRANLSAIVRQLHVAGPLSRSELVTRTGLTRSAIRGLIGELAAAELVTEERSAPLGTPGRPSPIVRPNPDAAMVLALEIEVDSLAAAIIGFGGSVAEVARVDRPREHLAPDEIVSDLAELARPMLARAGNRDRLLAVGVGVVGIVRRSDGVVAMAPNLGWREVPLGHRLMTALGLRAPIVVGNEADLGALAELRRGAAAGLEDVLYVSGEVGVGGGLIVGGQPLTGAAGYGGEIGHLPVNPAGRPCRCGSVGCWETEVGEEALLRRAGYPPDGGRDAVDAVLVEAASGSREARRALDEVGKWLGDGLAGLVNAFNPQAVVLGGLFSRIHPYVAGTVEARLDRLALAPSRSMVRVVPAMLAADAPLLGAAELAFEGLLSDPAGWLSERELLVAAGSA
jgi:predicted NBD/HSP70 family sugar kinase